MLLLILFVTLSHCTVDSIWPSSIGRRLCSAVVYLDMVSHYR